METLIISIVTALTTGGVVWGTTKATLNGTVARVARIEVKLHEVAEDVAFIKGVQHQEGLDREGLKH